MENLNAVLAAIADPSRREIIARLVQGPARVTEIAEPFDMSLNAVSKHLKVLEGAGLVSREKQGREHVITARAEPLRLVKTWLNEYEKMWSEQLDRVEEHFKNKRKRSKKS